MGTIRPQFDCQKYQKINISNKEYLEGLKLFFKTCSSNYSNYLNHYFTRKGGVIDGFRHINA